MIVIYSYGMVLFIFCYKTDVFFHLSLRID
jgi:hypothetical protein